VIFLDLDALLHIARRTLGNEPDVRDHGLLESALGRPQAWAFGQDAYPGIDQKAAALLHSLARNNALVDGNKRLALAATIAFYGMNGKRLTLSNDAAYALVIDVAGGRLDDVPAIASVLRSGTEDRSLLARATPA
jgi:death on curing protein